MRSLNGFRLPLFFLLLAISGFAVARRLEAAGPIVIKNRYRSDPLTLVEGKSGKAVRDPRRTSPLLVFPCDEHFFGTGPATLAFWTKTMLDYPRSAVVSAPGFKVGYNWVGKKGWPTSLDDVASVGFSGQIIKGKKRWSAGGARPKLNRWFHVALTRGKGGARLYLDGKLWKSSGRNLPAPLPGKGLVSICPQGLLDDVVILRGELSNAEVGKLYKEGRDSFKDSVAAVWDFDGDADGKIFPRADDSGCTLYWRTGKPLNMYRAACPTELELNVVNWSAEASEVTLSIHMEDLWKKVVLERTVPVKLAGRSQKIWKEKLDFADNGIFYTTLTLKRGEEVLGKKFLRIVRTIAPDVRKMPADVNFATGVVAEDFENWPEAGMKFAITRWTSWARLQNAPGAPMDFTWLEGEMDAAERNGVEVIFFTHHVPYWAAVDASIPAGGFRVAKDWKAYENYVYELARNFKGRFYALEVLNEPYCGVTVDTYLKFFEASARGLERGAPGTPLAA